MRSIVGNQLALITGREVCLRREVDHKQISGLITVTLKKIPM